MEIKISASEKKMKKYLDKMYQDCEYLDNVRPDWLINPKTGWSLELDRYYPALRIAFEFQGLHHRDDEYQRYKDRIKKKTCKNKKIRMVWIMSEDIKSFEKFKIVVNNVLANKRQNYIPITKYNTKNNHGNITKKGIASARRAGVIGSLEIIGGRKNKQHSLKAVG